jgi:hypothetical protein
MFKMFSTRLAFVSFLKKQRSINQLIRRFLFNNDDEVCFQVDESNQLISKHLQQYDKENESMLRRDESESIVGAVNKDRFTTK